MNLESERLSITEISSLDIPDIHEMNSYPEVAQFNTIGIPSDLAQTASVLKSVMEDQSKTPRTNYGWTIRDKESGAFIGEIGMSVSRPKYAKGEIHYSLHPEKWGKGYATEAVKAILDFGFLHLKLHRIEAGVATANVKSIKLLEKVGMTREGHHRKILPLQTGWSDNYSYAILDEDYGK